MKFDSLLLFCCASLLQRKRRHAITPLLWQKGEQEYFPKHIKYYSPYSTFSSGINCA